MPGSMEHCAGGGGGAWSTVLVVSEDVIDRDRKHRFIVKESPLFT